MSRATLLLLAAALLPACSESAPRPRNVLLISIDTLRPDRLGCYGHARDTSPAIDALAAEGTLFLDAQSTAPWTLPAHASLLTGLYPTHHGVKEGHHRLPGRVATLADELATHGLRTLAVVNSHFVGHPAFGLGVGFEDFRWVHEGRTDPVTGEVRIVNRADEVLDEARGMLDELGAHEPFFLFLHFFDVHTDLTPEPEWRERFVPAYDGPLTGRTEELSALRDAGPPYDPADLAWLGGMYDAELRQLDEALGAFLDELRADGRLDETLVVVTSDHGEELGEHGGLLHGRTHYRELLAVPLVMRGPGVPRGRTIERPVSIVDVVPTVLGLVDPEWRARDVVEHDGVDLAAFWRTPRHGAVTGTRALFAAADHGSEKDGEPVFDVLRSVRVGDEKLILDRLEERVELYDLAADPHERRDVAAERPHRVQRLLRLLQRHAETARAPDAAAAPSAEELRALRAAGYVGDDE